MLRSLVIAAALLVSAGPVGSRQPLTIRTVTMAGLTGPAYYSAVEQGYRFVGGRLTAQAPEHRQIQKPVEVSELAPTAPKGARVAVASAGR
ncbi:hypothetical protein [Jiella sp. M17.18]|uniref:hypothetical protein n=1 Tax=Jiella sp. M17.18 TaxID=3234247 RepID=UPI0034DF2B2F